MFKLSLRRLLRPLPWTLIALIATSLPAFAARTVVIDTSALLVEGVGEAQVLTMPEFTAESDEYTVSGASGRFDSSTEHFVATGAEDRPATLVRSGETPFTVTATERISIAFQDEVLEARGGVRYTGDGIEATSQLMLVDRHDRLFELVQELLAAVEPGATRDLVLEFFARMSDDARLVLMRGDVSVDREDSSLQAEWVVFNEENNEEFISVSAPGKPLRLSVVIKSDDEEPAAVEQSDEAPAGGDEEHQPPAGG